MRHFPLFFATEGARAVIVGGGEGAAQKFRLISRSSARITIMAVELGAELAEAVADGRADHVPAILDPAAFTGARLAIVCTGCAALDAAAADLARRAGALVNVVDRPAISDVIMPAIVDRDPVVVAVGTEGTAPVLARQIKTRLETWLEPSLGGFAAQLGAMRGRVAHKVAPRERRRFWEWVFGAPRRQFAEGDEATAMARIQAAMDAGGAGEAGGPVSLVTECARDLLTLGAVQRLQSADLILYGPGTPDGVLELARRDAERRQLSPADGPAQWRIERWAREAAAAQAGGGNVVWLTDAPREAAAILERLGAGVEIMPAAVAPSPVVARAEDG